MFSFLKRANTGLEIEPSTEVDPADEEWTCEDEHCG